MYSVLITDASEGIGLEMAREFLFEPNPPEHMFATYQQGESTRDLELLQQIFPQLKIFQLSVNTNTHVEENLRELREYVESYVGDAGLNILINNSKFYEYRLETLFLNATSTSIDTRQRYFPTNTTPPLQLIKEFYPLLKKAASQSNSLAIRVPSVIVNVTSLLRIQSHLSRVSRASNFYKVSKSALNFISQSTANQLPSQRILVVEIHPGTEIHSGLRDFHSIVLETRDIVKDLTGNGGNLLRSLEEDQHSEDKLFIPLGVSLLLKPIQLRAML